MKTRKLAMTSVMAALMCLAGMLLHWVSPALVPFSVLPVLVLMSGIILGAEYAAMAMLVYGIRTLWAACLLFRPVRRIRVHFKAHLWLSYWLCTCCVRCWADLP